MYCHDREYIHYKDNERPEYKHYFDFIKEHTSIKNPMNTHKASALSKHQTRGYFIKYALKEKEYELWAFHREIWLRHPKQRKDWLNDWNAFYPPLAKALYGVELDPIDVKAEVEKAKPEMDKIVSERDNCGLCNKPMFSWQKGRHFQWKGKKDVCNYCFYKKHKGDENIEDIMPYDEEHILNVLFETNKTYTGKDSEALTLQHSTISKKLRENYKNGANPVELANTFEDLNTRRTMTIKGTPLNHTLAFKRWIKKEATPEYYNAYTKCYSEKGKNLSKNATCKKAMKDWEQSKQKEDIVETRDGDMIQGRIF